MWWLAGILTYGVCQALAAWAFRNSPDVRTLVGNVALIGAALTPAFVVFRRRRVWRGCQGVFWTTIALGALAWAIGQVVWAAQEVLFGEALPWLRWYALLNLVGSAAPLLALLARPHRGVRRADAPIIAIDVAGLAAVAGFLYLFFIIGPGMIGPPPGGPPTLLLLVSQAQRLLLLVGMLAMIVRAHGTPWQETFRQLALAAAIGLLGRMVVNAAILRNAYYTGSLLDLAWSLPFLVYAWAAATAPPSPPAQDEEAELAFSLEPWLIFTVVAVVPFTEIVVGQGSHPDAALEQFRETVSNTVLFGLLGLLGVRMAVERTARRRTTARLRLMAAAVQQIDDLTLILRSNGGFEYANTAFCRAMGYTRRELENVPVDALFTPESRRAFLDLTEQGRRGGVGRGTLTRLRKDRTTFVTAVTIVPLMNARREITHFVGIERDITDDLKRRDQMIHAERLSAVGQLVSGVAHEINNPLQTIVGFTELMLGVERRPEPRRDLERIFTEANRAGKIVRNLLSFVRRSSHARSRDDLNDIVQSTVSLRAYELRVAGIELVEKYEPMLPPVFVNREEVQQVILNLVLNAEQAMLSADGRGRLSISTGRAGADLYVDVEDDGPGVPPTVTGQIFEPFFTTKEVGKGTGLGLSIGMGIAASHGGGLALLGPAGGRGARFRLTLPAAHTESSEATATHEQSAASSQAFGRAALVVDDEPAVRDLVARLLQRRGYRVDAAEDGEAALALARKRVYDLVLCDVKMPRMRGADVYERLEHIAPSLRQRFVFITGDVVSADIAELSAAQGVPMLSKPFTSADLDAVIAQIDPLKSDTLRSR